jgi:hypothetical protein
MAFWTIRAKRQLRHSLARVLCANREPADAPCLQPMADTVEMLDQILACTFDMAHAIVVRDLMVGFRRRDDAYVLLVEVEHKDQGGPFVVKVGSPTDITRELNGWNCCRPVGLRSDLVLLPLARGCSWPPGDQPQWMSLVYGDAHQFIGVERTVSLEEAFLNAVRYGNPSIQSIGFVIVELLERIGHLLHATSFVEDPAASSYVFRMPKVVQGVERWSADSFHRSIRSDTNLLMKHGVSEFIDPVEYFRQWVLPHFSHVRREEDGGETVVGPVVALGAACNDGAALPGGNAGSALAIPQPQDLIPYMLRGYSHGDLHGRNILVGLVHDWALWPTVFDYEDMGPNNLCGWDFVKLEVELKIRAYREIFPREEPLFRCAVRDGELKLHEATEQHHNDGSWPTVSASGEPAERLAAALLEIRRMASIHLGRNRGRARQWLEEYYFLLAAYGINMACYGNLERRELIAAYVTAGVAAARLSWLRSRWQEERRVLGL